MTTQPPLPFRASLTDLDPRLPAHGDGWLPRPPLRRTRSGAQPSSPSGRRVVRPAGGQPSSPQSGRLVVCTGARGGAGASVLAAALSRVAAGTGSRVLLVDGDELSAGLDLLLGAEHAPGMRWPDLALARGSLAPGLLGQSLPVIDGIRVLTGDRAARGRPDLGAVMPSVLEAGLAEHDLVVLDLPRSPMLLGGGGGFGGPVGLGGGAGLDGFGGGRGPSGLGGLGGEIEPGASGGPRGPGVFGEGLAALVDLALLVVPADVRSAAAAAAVRARTLAGVRDVQIVVRGPAPTGLSAASIATVLRSPLAADLRAEPGLDAALDRGEPPALRHRSPLNRACQAILEQLLNSSPPAGPASMGMHVPQGFPQSWADGGASIRMGAS